MSFLNIRRLIINMANMSVRTMNIYYKFIKKIDKLYKYSYIHNNQSLTTCNEQSICEYLTNPNGSVNIFDNATGCNNPSEVANACGISLLCLPYGNYYFNSQADIDNFPNNYPECNDLEGFVLINGNDITNLYGLSNISSIGEYLSIFSNVSLTDLSGLEGLVTIGNSLLIGCRFGGWGGILYGNNPLLTNLTGLQGLNFIGGALYVMANDMLTSLDGLDSLAAGSIAALSIAYNDSLSSCGVQSICDYLAFPNATIEIHDNAPGCNSLEEVEAACTVGIESSVDIRQSTVVSYPNPFSSFTTLEYELEHSANVNLSIFNHLGQRVAVLVDREQAAGRQQVRWEADGMPVGIYFYQLRAEGIGQVGAGKIVKY